MSNRPNTRPTSPRRRPPPRPAKRDGGIIAIVAGASAFAVVVGIIVVLGIAAVVYVAVQGGDDDVEGQVAPVAIEGEALPTFTGDDDDPAVGADAPRVEGVDFDREATTLAGSSDGEPTLAVFLAHWCPHCQAEVPRIVDWVADGTIPDDIRLVAVTTSTSPSQPNYPPEEWLESEGWPGDILVDSEEGQAGTAYGLGTFPYFVAIGADGTVTARGAGELGESEIVALIEALESAQ